MIVARYRWLIVLALAALAAGICPGGSAIRVQSDLVLINASVTDSHGNLVNNVAPSRFHVFEDGLEQVIQSFSGEETPASIGLVLDISGSMGDKLDLAKKSALQFVSTANPGDEHFLVEVRQRATVVLPFTNDVNVLLRTISEVRANGSTALFDAIHLAVSEVRRARHARKALLVISDGLDNHSRYTERETRRLLSELGFPIYTINLWQPQRSGSRYAMARTDPGTLEALAMPTGGRSYTVRDLKQLDQITQQISQAIRHEYVLAYVPSPRKPDGKYHRVKVDIDQRAGEPLKVSHRAGYWAPQPASASRPGQGAGSTVELVDGDHD